MEQIEKIVEFELYCANCKYLEKDDTAGEDPCNECLEHATNVNSSKPVNYVKEDKKKKKGNDKNDNKTN